MPWHWRARNVATLSISAWLFVSNVIYGTNAIIWDHNVKIVVPVWCDIVTKLQIGATMALPACCLCLCIHLERIASVREVGTQKRLQRLRRLFDFSLCWLLPMVYMALHYVVQGHRYDIVEDLGCRPATYNSLQSIFLVWVPPLIVVVLTLVYAGLALYHFFQRRITFARHLQSGGSALTTSRYFRLMAMAIVQMFWGALLIGINMWFTCRSGLRPWTGWADVHSNFSRVALFPTLLIPPSVLRWTYFLWWTIPISSVIFFAFFAFGQDAVKEYVACFRWVRSNLLRQKQDGAVFKGIKQPSWPASTSVKVPKFTPYSPSHSKHKDDQSIYDASSIDKMSFVMTPTSEASFAHTEITDVTDSSTPPAYVLPHTANMA